MQRLPQFVLIASTLVGSWLGMQAIHEAGHVIGAHWTNAEVTRVVLHPLTISRTDLGVNPHPLIVVWAGPVFGVIAPLVMWALAVAVNYSGRFVLRFFAGFCLIANGTYIGVGSFEGIGDCGQMLREGSPMWQLWLFGLVTTPVGLLLWHNEGRRFDLGAAKGQVDRAVALGSLVTSLLLVVLALMVGE